LLTGFWLRFSGLTRGESDLGESFEYYQFHPDEATLVRAAIAPLDPLDPPFTAYGLLPVYVLSAALWVQGLDELDLSLAGDRRAAFVTARAIAALLSSLVLVGTWVLGRRFFGQGPALLGLALVGFAPGAIQQGHFFIVDGFFTALGVAGLLAIALAVETGQRRWYVLAGLLVGALGAVRFNGLGLGLVLLGGHLARPGASLLQRLRAADLWLAGSVALATVLALQPYLLANPELLQRVDTSDDFALSLRFASGEILQPWTLVGIQGTRYWDHWFGLWPWIGGWPLTLALLAGAAHVAWRGSLLQRLVLAWCGLYFLSVGALPVKAVRYLVPLLPLLGLCTGALCGALWQRWRWPGALLMGVLLAHVLVYGLAFSRVYAKEDSRIQAAGWLAKEVPAGSRVGMETGAFNLRGLANPAGHEHKSLSVSGLFYGSAYMLCGQQVDYLGEHLEDMDWLALVTENRAVQFGAVPALFPVVASFYARLLAGELGFEPVRRFVVEPEFLGLRFGDRAAEPSFLAYDHPEVQVLRRREGAALTKALAVWRGEVSEGTHCPDEALRRAAEALRRGAEAEALIEQIQARYPHVALAHLLAAEARWRLGDEAGGEAAYRRYLPEQARGLLAHVPRSPFKHYTPGDAALACLQLGLEDLALRVLRRGLKEVEPVDATATLEMAESYLEVGRSLMGQGRIAPMEEVLALALEIHPHKVAYNMLATAAYERGDYERAVAQWRASLALDEGQGETHATLGQVLLVKLGVLEEALWHLQRAVGLEPGRGEELERWIGVARERLAEER
jgi:tetratricopeptide (TPR) repeat protein